MKKIVSTLLLLSMFSNVAIADCDFSKVVHNPDGTMTYTKELHICVGQMKQDLDAANTQITEYKKVIDLKDLAIKSADARADLWMNADFKLQDRMNAIDSLEKKNFWVSFGLGILVTSAAVWGAGQLRH